MSLSAKQHIAASTIRVCWPNKNSKQKEAQVPDTRSRMTNRLLAALPAAELSRIMPSLEHVDLR